MLQAIHWRLNQAASVAAYMQLDQWVVLLSVFTG
jgi:hypothetical protein